MNYKNYFKMLALSLLVASCSSNDDFGNEEIKTGPDGNAYLNLAFNLPTRNANSRAGNDTFEDGAASEYQVNSAELVTFIGADETTATVAEVINMVSFQPWNTVGETTDQVTARREVVQEITNIPTGTDKIYAFVVLNMAHNDVVDIFGVGKKLSDVMEATVSTMTGVGDGIIMMNAPLAHVNGTATTVKTLVEVTADHIKPTATEAQQAGAVEIYLERGVAKVTIGTHNATGTFNEMPIDPNNAPLTVALDSWAIDYTNTTSYFARNVSEFDTWKDYEASPTIEKRMVGTVAVGSAAPYNSAYRVYWAKDPNYTQPAANTNDNLNRIKDTDVANGWDDVEYPLENVFDITNQRQNNATRLVFKASIKLNNNTAGSTVFQLSTDGKIYRIDNLRNLITSVIKYVMGDETSVVLKNDNQLSFYNAAGTAFIQKEDLQGTLSDDQFNTIKNNIGQITTYLNGVCYYTTTIKHFGEELTPWDVENDPVDYSSDAEGAKKWLGRYGVLRNNWYEINVNHILTLGTATVPEPVTPDKPVDEKSYHIDVACNILSWAKRSYGVDL